MSVCKLVTEEGEYRTNATAKIFRFLERNMGEWIIGSKIASVVNTHALSTRMSHIRQQLPGGAYYLPSDRLANLRLERERNGEHWYYRLVQVGPPERSGQLTLDGFGAEKKRGDTSR